MWAIDRADRGYEPNNRQYKPNKRDDFKNILPEVRTILILKRQLAAQHGVNVGMPELIEMAFSENP